MQGCGGLEPLGREGKERGGEEGDRRRDRWGARWEIGRFREWDSEEMVESSGEIGHSAAAVACVRRDYCAPTTDSSARLRRPNRATTALTQHLPSPYKTKQDLMRPKKEYFLKLWRIEEVMRAFPVALCCSFCMLSILKRSSILVS